MSKKKSDKSVRMDQLKAKFREETGFDISQYGNLDKAELTSRQNGYVGGYIGGTMTKRMIEMAEEQMSNQEARQ
ncbi:MAG TPA: alpha/beta-type small acid-soluble spore protein [Bacillota bacterium]|nr:alpha/beta-type small acid-soluble spore protein [Bacillota bacterium]